MKTRLVIAFVAVAAVAQARPWQLQLQWGSQENFMEDGLPDVVDPSGNVVPLTSTWAARIMDAVTEDIYVTAHHTGSGLGWGFWDFVGDEGIAFQTVTLPIAADTRQIFTRIYNHSDPAMATMMADVGFTTFDWDVWAWLPPLPVGYNFGTVRQSDWKVVPEPGAAGLLLLGGAAALVVRRMKARAVG